MSPYRPREVEVRVGIDLIQVARLTRLLEEHPQAIDEIFTASEQDYCALKRRRAEHLAARFAAKEAVLKALGTGLVHQMDWTDVEVVNQPTGRPTILLHGAVSRLAERRGMIDLDVSLSHTADFAVANAIVVSAGSGSASAEDS